jgi:NAD+ synthase (glutamine-hydrolysing)
MKLIKVAAGILNQTALDWEHNQQNIVAAIRAAREQGVTLLCLPEMAIPGYGCEDAFHAPSLHRTCWSILQEIAPETTGLIVAVGLPVFHQNAVFNCACLLVDGAIAGFTAKKFLAGDGIHYEPRFFKPWPVGVQNTLEIGGQSHPIGDLYFDCGGIRLGFEICEDAWVSTRPGSALALHGVDVILNPSASHFAFGKHQVRQRFVIEGSRAFGVSYLYANLLGNDAGRVIYDGGALIASQGRLVAAGPRFTYADFHLTTAVVDVEANRLNQSRTSSFKPNLVETPQAVVKVPFEYPDIPWENPLGQASPWETSAALKEEEFTRAVSLALFDYLRKSHANGLVVSLSGGADSSAVCCLIHLMARQALAELGAEGVRAKLPDLQPPLPAGSRLDARRLTHRLLTTAYQATRNSSATTRNAARTVARGVGAEHFEWDVDELVQGYVGRISRALRRPLTWAQDDLSLQNIQARVRSPGIWLLANLRNALLLSTSNRSEAAVGYATMDGDTSGGLCPIAGIDKAFLRHWLRWLETQGPAGLGPLPFVKAVNRQEPTAELRPGKEKQTDEADLMPYDILDAVERAAIRDKMDPVEIWRRLQVEFPTRTPAQLATWIQRFFRLWCRNQWKRERYAPSFHLDDENLDPKTWCRFPILSGGFARELRLLAAEAAAAPLPKPAIEKREGRTCR